MLIGDFALTYIYLNVLLYCFLGVILSITYYIFTCIFVFKFIVIGVCMPSVMLRTQILLSLVINIILIIALSYNFTPVLFVNISLLFVLRVHLYTYDYYLFISYDCLS